VPRLSAATSSDRSGSRCCNRRKRSKGREGSPQTFFWRRCKPWIRPLEPIFCGGNPADRPGSASSGRRRAIRSPYEPGVNLELRPQTTPTLAELTSAGFRVMTADETADRWRSGRVITIEGGELVRGGGGPPAA